MDPWLRAELGMLALVMCAVLFWRLRVPLDGLARSRGALAASGVALALLTLIAIATAAIAARRLQRAIAGRPPGPSWLALPCEDRRLAAHFAWNARSLTPLAVLPAGTVLLALGALVPWYETAALALGFTAMLPLAERSALALVLRSRLGKTNPPMTLSRSLASPRAGRARDTAHRRPRLGRTSWPSLFMHDLRLTRHVRGARSRGVVALSLVAAAALPWFAPWPLPLAHAVGFGVSLIAAAASAAWVIEVAALHPPVVLHSLPLGTASWWFSRAWWALAATALLLAFQAPGARRLDPSAAAVYRVWVGGAAAAIGVLGANLAVTLHPRADHAHRVLSLWLALAMVASFIIPLLGWVLILTVVIQSARRLPRWARGAAA